MCGKEVPLKLGNVQRHFKIKGGLAVGGAKKYLGTKMRLGIVIIPLM